MEALHLVAYSYFGMFDFDTCKRWLAQIWMLNGKKFDEEFLMDKRFQQMFSTLALLENFEDE